MCQQILRSQNHTEFEDASCIYLNLFFVGGFFFGGGDAFPLTHWRESHKVFLTTRVLLTTEEHFFFFFFGVCFCETVCTSLVFTCRAAGGGGQPNTLHSLTRRLWSLSVLLLFLNTDPYLPTAQELSRLTSAMLTQAWIKNSLFTPRLRLY